MNEFVERRIREREIRLYQLTQQLRALQQERRDLQAELRAYKDVFEHISPSESASKPDGEASKVLPPQRTRTRLSDSWKALISHIRDAYPSTMSIDGLKAYVKVRGFDVSDESLRSQLSFYASRGWLERVSTGQYRITAEGAESIGEPLETESNPDQSQDGGVDSELENLSV